MAWLMIWTTSIYFRTIRLYSLLWSSFPDQIIPYIKWVCSTLLWSKDYTKTSELMMPPSSSDESGIWNTLRSPKNTQKTKRRKQHPARWIWSSRPERLGPSFLFLSWKRGEEGRSELDQVVFVYWRIFQWKLRWGKFEEATIALLFLFLRRIPPPKMGILALLNRKNYSRLWNRKVRYR